MGKIKTIIINNIKLFSQKRLLLLSAIVFPVLFFFLFSMIFISHEDVDKIPIAIIDEDQTELSSDTMMRLRDNHALKIMSTELEEANRLLNSNRIEGIFILKEGFEEGLIASSYENSVALIYLESSPIGPALSDIIASDMMMPIAVYKAANQAEIIGKDYGYNDMFEKTVAIGQTLIRDAYFEMVIDSQVVIPRTLLEEAIDIQEILRINTTIGYSLIVFSFVLMFINGHMVGMWQIKKRLIISGYKAYHFYIADTLSFILTGFILMLCQIIILIIGLKITQLEVIITMMYAMTLHVVFLSQLVLLLTSLIQDKSKYQSVIAPLLFLLGLLGGAFWSTEVLSDDIIQLVQISPIYWTLQWIGDSLIHLESKGHHLQYILYIIVFTLSSIGVYQYRINKLQNP